MLTQLKFSDHRSRPVAAASRRAQVPPFRTLFGCDELAGASVSFARNAEVYGEGEERDFVYQVITGAVRSYKILSDGRRQIDAFYLPGDIFGLESGSEHWRSAEAIVPSSILLMRRSVLIRVAERRSEVTRQLYAHAVAELQRAQNHSLLLVRSAQERVAAFLLDMAGRTGNGTSVDLPMPRQDIADYLGLTIETVSRMMTQLTEASTIQLIASRRIVLRDRVALSELND